MCNPRIARLLVENLFPAHGAPTPFTHQSPALERVSSTSDVQAGGSFGGYNSYTAGAYSDAFPNPAQSGGVGGVAQVAIGSYGNSHACDSATVTNSAQRSLGMNGRGDAWATQVCMPILLEQCGCRPCNRAFTCLGLLHWLTTTRQARLRCAADARIPGGRAWWLDRV